MTKLLPGASFYIFSVNFLSNILFLKKCCTDFSPGSFYGLSLKHSFLIFVNMFLILSSFEYSKSNFFSNVIDRNFLRIIFNGFSFEYSLADIFYPSMIFLRIFFHGYSSEYFLTCFLSNIFSGISVWTMLPRIFFFLNIFS